MKLILDDNELDVLISLFDALMNEASNQMDLCIDNNDVEEYAQVDYLFGLYWKMLSYLRWTKNAR